MGLCTLKVSSRVEVFPSTKIQTLPSLKRIAQKFPCHHQPYLRRTLGMGCYNINSRTTNWY
uniref:Uncharacterized protein n=1 Tax=Cucumis melo TaxID=3656 RepID=A0A9I9EKH2_CUCME